MYRIDCKLLLQDRRTRLLLSDEKRREEKRGLQSWQLLQTNPSLLPKPFLIPGNVCFRRAGRHHTSCKLAIIIRAPVASPRSLTIFLLTASDETGMAASLGDSCCRQAPQLGGADKEHQIKGQAGAIRRASILRWDCMMQQRRKAWLNGTARNRSSKVKESFCFFFFSDFIVIVNYMYKVVDTFLHIIIRGMYRHGRRGVEM